MTFPGERVQIDVKMVPTECLVGELQIMKNTIISTLVLMNLVDLDILKFLEKIYIFI